MGVSGDASGRAVTAVEQRAADARADAVERIERALGSERAGIAVEAAPALTRRARLTLNFHPDRVGRTGRSVAAGLTESGRYLSQWATWLSNGERSATPGGRRHRWEHELFDAAYDECDPADTGRPVYGTLDLLHDPHGGAPRFGSCYLVLEPHVVERTTFCVGDSHVGPRDLGARAELLPIVAGLAEQAEFGLLLARPLGLDDLLAALTGAWEPRPPARDLDGYVEAQVHGGVDLAVDANTIVADPAFRESRVERDLVAAAHRYDLELRWHGGSVLAVDAVPDDFRGVTMPSLAADVAEGEPTIDAASIGRRAARSVSASEPTLDGDVEDSDAQQLKKLWHCVLALGRDAEAA